MSKRTQLIGGALGLLLMAALALGCSSSESAESAPPQATESAADDSSAQGADAADDETASEANASETSENETSPTTTPEPTLEDQDLASVQELQAGEQVEDAHGNLIAIYGIAVWPESFDALSDATQAEFPFFGDVQAVADPSSQLVVLDVGMCAAGIDVRGFGTAEFFVHESPTEIVSTDPVMGRGVLTRHPVARPGFGFPSPAECERGFLPVLWAEGQTPAVARYVLATRASAGADVEQHVYQWDLDLVDVANPDEDDDAAASAEPQFVPGQTVTFNQGRLQDTTVEVDGWAELIGAASPVEGTRLVAVSLGYCPSSAQLPEFGIGVNNWNIVAPAGDVTLGAGEAEDPTATCFDGWLEFAIPFGSVPTAFFASDGANAETGYVEWSLLDAALPAPQP